MIKDSGDRTAFETGAVRDMHRGKGRYDLIPWEAVHELAIHCEQGAIKYGERNVEKGIPIHSLIDSATRHISCYLRGMDDKPHLRAALWNIAFAIWMEKNRPEMQDIPARSVAHTDKEITVIGCELGPIGDYKITLSNKAIHYVPCYIVENNPIKIGSPWNVERLKYV